MIGAMAISRGEFDRFAASMVLRLRSRAYSAWADRSTAEAMANVMTTAYKDATGDTMTYVPGEGHLDIPSRVEIHRDGETKVFGIKLGEVCEVKE